MILKYESPGGKTVVLQELSSECKELSRNKQKLWWQQRDSNPQPNSS